MRLLDTRRFIAEQTGILSDFHDVDRPPYAILSHCWEKDEFVFPDLHKLEALRSRFQLSMRTPAPRIQAGNLEPMCRIQEERLELQRQMQQLKAKQGYGKVLGTCKEALKNCYSFVWIDTCCIDKSSSAELQEAINSMWHWYAEADICYVYLGDLLQDSDWAKILRSDLQRNERSYCTNQLRSCRWFSRGWTLQELLSPRSLTFYTSDWKVVGMLQDIALAISKCTRIELGVLMHEVALTSLSVAKRMSWAAHRETTRVEDRAYSLLGIFNVHMPLLYGERENAFLRLQQEIIRISPDQSILAWTPYERSDDRWYEVPQELPLLAPSPASFATAQDSVCVVWNGIVNSIESTNAGLRLWTWLVELEDELYGAVLDCSHEPQSDRAVALILRKRRVGSPDWDREENYYPTFESCKLPDGRRSTKRTRQLKEEQMHLAKRKLIIITSQTGWSSSLVHRSKPSLLWFRFPTELQIVDTLPVGLMDGRIDLGARASLNAPRVIDGKSYGAFMLRHRNGDFVLLVVRIEDDPEDIYRRYYGGFSPGLPLLEATQNHDWYDLSNAEAECRFETETFKLEHPDLDSRVRSYVVRKVDS